MITINKNKFNELLEHDNLTHAKFAMRLGVSRTQVWRILNFKSNPGAEFIAKFTKKYPNKKFEEYFFVINDA
ncbi:MAG: helix-turn-helix domain-containing protein [Cellulosilyticaceae bacterium]